LLAAFFLQILPLLLAFAYDFKHSKQPSIAQLSDVDQKLARMRGKLCEKEAELILSL